MVVLWHGLICIWILYTWSGLARAIVCTYNFSVFIRTAYHCAGTFENDFPMYFVICSSLTVLKGVVVHTGGHNLAREEWLWQTLLAKNGPRGLFQRGTLICVIAHSMQYCDGRALGQTLGQ